MNSRSTWRLAGALIGFGMVSAACGELTQPAAFAPTTSSTLVADAEQETSPEVEEVPGLATGVDEFVPSPAASYIPSLLISGPTAVFSVDDGGLVDDGATEDDGVSAALTGPLADLQTTRVVDDLGGGLVSQEVTGEIIYRPSQGAEEILSPAEAGDVLLDVGFWDGSPRALVQVGERQVDWIQLITERPGAERERQIHIELAEDEEIVALSASRDLQAVIVQDRACGELRFFDSEGRLIPLEGPEPPPCELNGFPVYGAVALSHDGGAVAYTLVSYRGDTTEAGTDLVARELIAGSEAFFGRRIGEAGDSIASLAFDGQRTAYLRNSDVAQSVTLLNLVDGAELPVDLTEVGEASSVSFARIPVSPSQ